MQAVNYTNLRNNMKEYLDRVAEDREAYIVTRKNDKNVVLISLEEYNNLLENAYIMSDANYYGKLLESKKQVEAGDVVYKTSEELEKLLKDHE